jgi:hypothetical protein
MTKNLGWALPSSSLEKTAYVNRGGFKGIIKCLLIPPCFRAGGKDPEVFIVNMNRDTILQIVFSG